MPLRSDVPSGFSLSRRTATPVKLPKMNFPLGGMTDGSNPQFAADNPANTEFAQPQSASPQSMPPQYALSRTSTTQSMPPEFAPNQSMPPQFSPSQSTPTQSMPPQFAPSQAFAPASPAAKPVAQTAPQPTALPPVAGSRVIVYGRSGCEACLQAIQDLIDRQVSFAYYDIDRDAAAMNHIQAICGSRAEAVLPIIVQMGFAGAS